MRVLRLLALAIVAALALLLAPLPPADAGEDYEQVVDLTFPTDPRATYVDDYDHGRSGGRTHGATDLMGERGWPVFAAVGGEVTWMPETPHATAGYAIAVDGDDERTYRYIHLDGYADGIAPGVEVERGELIGTLGSTGNAGTPHLHFEIDDERVTDPYGGHRINPYFSLLDAERREDYADEPPAPAVDRISGPERVATAAAMAARAFPGGAERVVLASATAYADAIVAGPLAAALDAPVLTTYGDRLHDRTVHELGHLGVEEVVVLDGGGSLSEQVVEDLTGRAGLDPGAVTLIEAGSAPELAAAVAERVWALTGSSGALVALGSHPEPARAWPDALTAGYYGAVLGEPVLLVDPDLTPEATVAALAGAERATIVGGTAAVSDEREAELAAAAGEVRRLWGTNRYGTAAAVAGDALDRGFVETDRVWAATGYDYADALAAAAVVARMGDVLVLVEGEVAPGDAPLDDWLAGREEPFERGRVIGGTAAITEDARLRLAERISGG